MLIRVTIRLDTRIQIISLVAATRVHAAVAAGWPGPERRRPAGGQPAAQARAQAAANQYQYR